MIYTVEEADYEWNTVKGVFSSRELAQEYIDIMDNEDMSIREYNMDEALVKAKTAPVFYSIDIDRWEKYTNIRKIVDVDDETHEEFNIKALDKKEAKTVVRKHIQKMKKANVWPTSDEWPFIPYGLYKLTLELLIDRLKPIIAKIRDNEMKVFVGSKGRLYPNIMEIDKCG